MIKSTPVFRQAARIARAKDSATVMFAASLHAHAKFARGFNHQSMADQCKG